MVCDERRALKLALCDPLVIFWQNSRNLVDTFPVAFAEVREIDKAACDVHKNPTLRGVACARVAPGVARSMSMSRSLNAVFKATDAARQRDRVASFWFFAIEVNIFPPTG